MYKRGFISLVVILFLLSTAVVHAQSYFQWLPPHAALPSGANCAKIIVQQIAETRPENSVANNTIPSASELMSFHSSPTNFEGGPPASDFARVDGNYRGTTDMIVRWAACKWGIDQNTMRAQSYGESYWTQSELADTGTSYMQCVAGSWDGWYLANGGGYCLESYGVFQDKVLSYNAWPEVWFSTAFNADLRGAVFRACINGDESYLGSAYLNDTTPEDRYIGCTGSWDTGDWMSAAALDYINYTYYVMQVAPWNGDGPSPSVTIISPKQNATVKGLVTVSVTMNQKDPNACYACMSVDATPQSCTPSTGPWVWNTLSQAYYSSANYPTINGQHVVQVDTYPCSGGNGWAVHHAAVNVNVEN